MNDRVAVVLPAWASDLPGYHAVLVMRAFSLEECGEYERAEQAARAALAMNPFDARAHHVMAHVFEMTERADAGVRWMNEHIAAGALIASWRRTAGGTWRCSIWPKPDGSRAGPRGRSACPPAAH